MSADSKPDLISAPADSGLTGDEALVDATQGEVLYPTPVAGAVEPDDPDLDDEIAAQEVPE